MEKHLITLKYISIIPRRHPLFKPWYTNQHNGLLVRNADEKWSFDFSCQEQDKPDENRELTQITIDLHNGMRWIGNIQDLASIYYSVSNGLYDLQEFNRESKRVAIAPGIQELESLLSHFSKITDAP